MSEKQPDDNQPQTTADTPADEQPSVAKPKLTPLEAIKARQAAMRNNQRGQGQHSGGGSEGADTGGPTKRPNLQRKMGG